ncbi:hypothetical protein BDN72DRAFT_902434 [Pluteus cervinus]|uniref:Uncharacterized protein n=1 Tax=Pluteus cervinus TaxID=181527 RepID=A0ACD3ACK8_9AGAR|nr:hypothetical protein BDN72DRAFT_902434 [Pluteus cervinus]
MSSVHVVFYEPFYDLDRVFDEAFTPVFRGPQRIQSSTQGQETNNGAVRSLKPRQELDKASNEGTEFSGSILRHFA